MGLRDVNFCINNLIPLTNSILWHFSVASDPSLKLSRTDSVAVDD